MSPSLWPLLLESAVLIPAALGVLALLHHFGLLRPAALAVAPPRTAGLAPSDLLVGVALMLAGGLLATALSQQAAASAPSPAGRSPAADLGRQVLLGQLGALPLLLFIVWRVRAVHDGLHVFGLRCPRPASRLLFGLLALVAAMPVVLAVGLAANAASMLWVETPPEMGHEILRAVLDDQAPWSGTVVLLIAAVLVAPVVEEILYRGLVQTVLLELGGRSRRWSVVTIASCWFTLVHSGGTGSGPVVWQSLPQLFVLAMFLGWLYERTGNLWPSIVLHAGFNATNFAFVLAMRRWG